MPRLPRRRRASAATISSLNFQQVMSFRSCQRTYYGARFERATDRRQQKGIGEPPAANPGVWAAPNPKVWPGGWPQRRAAFEAVSSELLAGLKPWQTIPGAFYDYLAPAKCPGSCRVLELFGTERDVCAYCPASSKQAPWGKPAVWHERLHHAWRLKVSLPSDGSTEARRWLEAPLSSTQDDPTTNPRRANGKERR